MQWLDSLATRIRAAALFSASIGRGACACPSLTLQAWPSRPEPLERRPDIAAAQRRVAVAYAQIGVADAAYFPDISLSASAGYRGTSLSNLVNAPNLLWSLGASLTQPIFDGGQHKLASAQAPATAE